MSTSPTTAEVTVVNADSWLTRTTQLAALLAKAANGAVIPDAIGRPANPDRVATVSGLAWWSKNEKALHDALGRLTGIPALRWSGDDHAPGAAESGPERLTLTVEESAVILGISRSEAYKAIQRGELPAIRIGRRVLVPRGPLL
jgi:excisionase family DNA binding protein